MTRACLLLALLAACTGGTTSKDTSPPTGSAGTEQGGSAVSMTMKPGMKTGGGPFVKGAPLTPAKDLVAWFESQKRNGEPRLTRVPIVLKRGPVGFQLRGARMGTSPDALEVYVSDAALGVGLADRARKCTEKTCNFIVEGYWRGDAEAPGFYKFDARTASQEPVSDAEIAAITHAEVEGESGN